MSDLIYIVAELRELVAELRELVTELRVLVAELRKLVAEFMAKKIRILEVVPLFSKPVAKLNIASPRICIYRRSYITYGPVLATSHDLRNSPCIFFLHLTI